MLVPEAYAAFGALISVCFLALFPRVNEKGARFFSIAISAYVAIAFMLRGYGNGYLMAGCAIVALAVFYMALRYRRRWFAAVVGIAFLSWVAASALSFIGAHGRLVTIVAVVPITAASLVSLSFMFIREKKEKHSGAL